MQTYQNAVPSAGEAYASHSFGDDLTLAALLLAYAENSTEYYQLASKWWDDYDVDSAAETLDWDNKAPAIPALFTQILTQEPGLGSQGDLDKWRTQAEKFLDSIVAADGPGYLTSGGLVYYDGTSDLTSLSPAMNAAMILVRYASYATTSAKTNAYLAFAKLQLDYILGNNPMQGNLTSILLAFETFC